MTVVHGRYRSLVPPAACGNPVLLLMMTTTVVSAAMMRSFLRRQATYRHLGAWMVFDGCDPAAWPAHRDMIDDFYNNWPWS